MESTIFLIFLMSLYLLKNIIHKRNNNMSKKLCTRTSFFDSISKEKKTELKTVEDGVKTHKYVIIDSKGKSHSDGILSASSVFDFVKSYLSEMKKSKKDNVFSELLKKPKAGFKVWNDPNNPIFISKIRTVFKYYIEEFKALPCSKFHPLAYGTRRSVFININKKFHKSEADYLSIVPSNVLGEIESYLLGEKEGICFNEDDREGYNLFLKLLYGVGGKEEVCNGLEKNKELGLLFDSYVESVPDFYTYTPKEIERIKHSSRNAGTQLHLCIEHALNDNHEEFAVEIKKTYEEGDRAQINEFRDFFLEKEDIAEFKTEFSIGCLHHRIAGTIDLVYVNKEKKCFITDFKRTSSWYDQGVFSCNSKQVKIPISKIKVSDILIKYVFQLSIYRELINIHRKDADDEYELMSIIYFYVFHPSYNEFKIIEIDLEEKFEKNTVEKMFPGLEIDGELTPINITKSFFSLIRKNLV